MRKNKFSLKQEYKKCFEYIYNSRKFILLSIAIFFLFFLVGFLIPIPEILYNEILKILQEILSETENLSQIELIFILSLII